MALDRACWLAPRERPQTAAQRPENRVACRGISGYPYGTLHRPPPEPTLCLLVTQFEVEEQPSELVSEPNHGGNSHEHDCDAQEHFAVLLPPVQHKRVLSVLLHIGQILDWKARDIHRSLAELRLSGKADPSEAEQTSPEGWFFDSVFSDVRRICVVFSINAARGHSSRCRVLFEVPSQIGAGRLCKGRERRSPSKSERELKTVAKGETLLKYSDTSESHR